MALRHLWRLPSVIDSDLGLTAEVVVLGGPTMIITAFIYDDAGTERIGVAQLDVGCGDAWCDSCGDCMHCYGDDDGCPKGSHWWVLYEHELPAWFGATP